jgi:hypothetical protein
VLKYLKAYYFIIRKMSSVGDEEENAAELQFGPEFGNDVQYLTNDEAYFLLSKRPVGTNTTE